MARAAASFPDPSPRKPITVINTMLTVVDKQIDSTKYKTFSATVLNLDAAAETASIVATMKAQVAGELHRRGAVVGLSGGIDSSVVAALCVRALGKDRVLGLFMPERDSVGRLAAARARCSPIALGIEAIVEDIAPALAGAGCYARQEEAIRMVVPEYGDGWKCKLTLPSILESDRLNVYAAHRAEPGRRDRDRAHADARPTLQLVAATNYKQRIRKMTEYYHADRLQLRRRRHAEPARVRPGILREAGRRRGRLQADRAPLQDPGLRPRGASRRARGDPQPAADDRHVLDGADAGGVLLRAAVRPMDLCLYAHNHNVAAADVARGGGPHARSRSSASTRTSTPSAAPRATCTRRRCSGRA